MNLKDVADCLNEYGAALRGDWGCIDGRSEQAALSELADAILNPEVWNIDRLRNVLDICPIGGGHWTDHCNKTCEAP